MTPASDFDYDWLVIGSGFGGSVSALRLAEKGYTVGRARERRRFAGPRLPALHLGPAALLLGAAAGHARHLPAERLQGRYGGQRHAASAAAASATRTRSTCRHAASSRTPSGRELDEDWEATLAPHYAEAERMLGVDRLRRGRPGRPAAARARRATSASATRTRKTRVGRVLRRARRHRARSVLRRRGPGPHGLHALRALHGRLPLRREEHARQELPVLRRAPGRADHARARRWSTCAPLGARDGSEGYGVLTESSGAWLRKSAATLTRARRRRRRRRARHQPAAAALPAARLAAAGLRPPRRARAHQQRGDPRGDRAARRPGGPHQAASPSPRASTPTPTRTSRPCATAHGGDAIQSLLHDARRRRAARHRDR